MTLPVFQQLQRAQLAYLRRPSPELQPAGFDGERLAVYVELLYNKFDESLSACFPVLHSILGSTRWRALLKDFIAEHRCLSPYYRQIPDEFVLYLQHERRNPIDPPYLVELAHFEWIELVLSIAEAEPVAIESLSDEQLLQAVPVFAPVMRLLHYVWPVQQINRAYQAVEPPPAGTDILGFRDADEQVRFIALNPATSRLLQLLQSGLSGYEALHLIGETLNPQEPSALIPFGTGILADLHRQGAIIGIHPTHYEQST